MLLHWKANQPKNMSMKLSDKDKKAIREAAAMIYAAAECDEIYGKESFMSSLKKTISNTPIVNGYAESMRVLDNIHNS